VQLDCGRAGSQETVLAACKSACPWRIDIVAGFEPNVTMLH
jgi:hypothetical protein